MSFSCPIFLVDTDRFMTMLQSDKELVRLEAIDVEDNEYKGWDRDGFPLSFSLDKNNRIVVTRSGNEPQLDALISSLKYHFDTYGNKAKFKTPLDFSELYELLKDR